MLCSITVADVVARQCLPVSIAATLEIFLMLFLALRDKTKKKWKENIYVKVHGNCQSIAVPTGVVMLNLENLVTSFCPLGRDLILKGAENALKLIHTLLCPCF